MSLALHVENPDAARTLHAPQNIADRICGKLSSLGFSKHGTSAKFDNVAWEPGGTDVANGQMTMVLLELLEATGASPSILSIENPDGSKTKACTYWKPNDWRTTFAYGNSYTDAVATALLDVADAATDPL